MYVHSKPKSADFLITERITINIALKALMDSRQKKQNDLLKPRSDPKKDKSTTSLCRVRDKVNLRTNQKMTEMLGFKNKDTFYHALEACKKDILPLVNSLNYKKIANLMKFNSKSTDHNAKQVFSQGSLSLINLIDQRIISINAAFKISKSPANEQNACIEKKQCYLTV